MMRVYGKELNAWVYQELRRRIPDIQEDFMEKMQLYFEDPQYCAMEKRFCALPIIWQPNGNLS